MFDVGLELSVKVEDLDFWKRLSAHDGQKAVCFGVHLEGVPKDDKIDDVWQEAKFGKEKDGKRKRKLGEFRALRFRKKLIDWTLEHCRPRTVSKKQSRNVWGKERFSGIGHTSNTGCGLYASQASLCYDHYASLLGYRDFLMTEG